MLKFLLNQRLLRRFGGLKFYAFRFLFSSGLWKIIGLAGVGIFAQLSITSCVTNLGNINRLHEIQTRYEAQLSEQQKAIEAQAEAYEAAKAEVAWARDYVSQQESAIKKLRAEASIEVNECLDLYIDPAFID